MFKIESVNLDGFGRKVFVNEDIIWFNGIVIDYFNSRIYWVDIKKQTIEIFDMEGQDRYVVRQFDSMYMQYRLKFKIFQD